MQLLSLKLQEEKTGKSTKSSEGSVATQVWMVSCSVLDVPHGLKKGNSILRRLECLAGSFVAAAFVVDFEVEGVLEQQDGTKPLTELVLAECNCRGKFFLAGTNTVPELGLSLVLYLNCLCNLTLLSSLWCIKNHPLLCLICLYKSCKGNTSGFNFSGINLLPVPESESCLFQWDFPAKHFSW